VSATWAFVLGPPAPAAGQSIELTQATGRQLVFRVDAPATAAFAVDGRAPEAALIAPLATDLTIRRNGTALFRGRIGAESDSIDATKHQASFAASDYRGMLAYRRVGAAGRTFTQVDQGAIAWTLISENQALPGRNWGITNGVGATSGQLRDRTIDPGTPILKVITDMGQVLNGFEWEISPDLVLNRWYPTRGSATGRLLTLGGNVASATRKLDPGGFANFVIATGDKETTPVTATASDIATDARGAFEFQQGSTIKEQTTLTARAPWLLDQMKTVPTTWNVTLAAERWDGPADIWLGDTVGLWIRSGRLDAQVNHRVVELRVAIGDNGGETVTLGLLAVP
jgi:hypothetical protein